MEKCVWSLLVVLLLFSFRSATAQTLVFTYQGSLKSAGAPASGNFDFEFALFNSATVGSQVGATNSVNNVAVTNGVFSVSLNFGNVLSGSDRFLEIRVRPAGGGAFTVLAPRQQLLSAPYAIRSLTAGSASTAENAFTLSGFTANQFVLTSDARLTDARQPLPGSANYIQNSTVQQASSNFNISGTGTADIFNATQYNIFNVRFISNAGGNTLVGLETGLNTTGTSNSFFGNSAGRLTTSGGSNSFFGSGSGR
jgi:hypothetical protein